MYKKVVFYFYCKLFRLNLWSLNVFYYLTPQMYLFLNLALIITTFLMGSVFLIIPVPDNPGLKNYKTSLRILAGAYFSLSLLNAYVMYLDLNNAVPDYFNFIDLLISSVQVVLFTFTMIILFDPGFITHRRLIKNLIPIALFVLVYILF